MPTAFCEWRDAACSSRAHHRRPLSRLRELILGQELLWAATAYQRALWNDKASGKIRAVPSEAAREAESKFQGQLENVRAAIVPFRYAVRSSLQHLDDVEPPLKSEPHY
jgi:hypothetical protein